MQPTTNKCDWYAACPYPKYAAVKRAVRAMAKSAGPILLRPRNWGVKIQIESEFNAEKISPNGPMASSEGVIWSIWIEDIGIFSGENADFLLDDLRKLKEGKGI